MLTRTITRLRWSSGLRSLTFAEEASQSAASEATSVKSSTTSSLIANVKVNSMTRRVISTTMRRMLVASASSSDSSTIKREKSFRVRVLNQNMEFKDGLPTVIVAGAAGRLGRKIYNRLLNTTAANYVNMPLSARPKDAPSDAQEIPTRFRIILMDKQPCPQEININDAQGHEVEYVQCDFTKFDDSWAEKFSNAYVAFLLATRVRFPTATSDEAYDSMLINANLLEACVNGNVERVVLGSSTAVVRGKVQNSIDSHQVKSIASAPTIDSETEPEIPEKRKLWGDEIDSRLYAAAKVAAEAQAQALVAAGHLNRVIVLRLGACYPIDNLVSSDAAKQRINSENDTVEESEDSDDYLLDWFKQVQLKEEDLDKIIDCCVTPGLDATPANNIMVVNAVSAKEGSKFRIEDNDFGYFPPPSQATSLPAAIQ